VNEEALLRRGLDSYALIPYPYTYTGYTKPCGRMQHYSDGDEFGWHTDGGLNPHEFQYTIVWMPAEDGGEVHIYNAKTYNRVKGLPGRYTTPVKDEDSILYDPEKNIQSVPQEGMYLWSGINHHAVTKTVGQRAISVGRCIIADIDTLNEIISEIERALSNMKAYISPEYLELVKELRKIGNALETAETETENVIEKLRASIEELWDHIDEIQNSQGDIATGIIYEKEQEIANLESEVERVEGNLGAEMTKLCRRMTEIGDLLQEVPKYEEAAPSLEQWLYFCKWSRERLIRRKKNKLDAASETEAEMKTLVEAVLGELGSQERREVFDRTKVKEFQTSFQRQKEKFEHAKLRSYLGGEEEPVKGMTAD